MDRSLKIDATRCPLCGGANACQRETFAPYKGPCWCESLTFPDAITRRIPEEFRDRCCVCQACVEAELRRRPNPAPRPGDTYLETGTGRMVFTAAYHRRRGFCCGNDCRHCPWSKESVGEETQPRSAGRIGNGVVLSLAASLLAISATAATTLTEDFANDPRGHGWFSAGNGSLFEWNAAAQRLDVTWDTVNRHSFFIWPLGTTVTAADDFSFALDLTVNDALGGVREGRPGAMQIALGLLNEHRATQENYQRGAGKAAETIEFDWFPAGFIPGYGAVEPTLSAIAFDQMGRVAANFDFPAELTWGLVYRIQVAHRASDRTLTATVETAGESTKTILVNLPATFGEFSLDAFAVLVWDETTSFGDSLLAHATVDNVTLTLPVAPIGAIWLTSPAEREVEFRSQLGWHYTLEASLGLNDWQLVSDAFPGTGKDLRLSDPRKAPFPRQFYRVRAERDVGESRAVPEL